MFYRKRLHHLQKGETLYVVPLGDIHYNTSLCDRDRFHDRLAWAQQQAPNVLVIGMGDYLNTMSTTERAATSQGLHGDTKDWLDSIIRQDVERLCAVWTVPTVVLLEGNHYWRYTNGSTSTRDMAEILGADYVQGIGCIDIVIAPRQCVRLCITHGYGATSRTPGSRLKKRMDLARIVPDAHVYVMGHDHELLAKAQDFVSYDAAGKLIAYKQYFVASGSFLRGYDTDGRVTYAEAGYYPPASLGAPIISIQRGRRQPVVHVQI